MTMPLVGGAAPSPLAASRVSPLAAAAVGGSVPVLPWLAVALGVGIATYFALNEEPPPWLGPFLVVLLLWPAFRLRRKGVSGLVSALVLAAAIGFAAAQLRTAQLPPPLALPARAVLVEGVVAAVDQLPEARRVRLVSPVLEDAAEPLRRDLRIRLHHTDAAPLQPGDRVRVRALLQPPAPPATPGGFDFQRVAFFDRLGGVGFALAPAERVAMAEASGLGLALARLRQRIISAARDSIPGAEGAVAAALLTGQRQAIPQPVMEDLRRSGLAHLLAVSGLHVGIVAGLAFVLVRLGLGLWPSLLLRLPVKKIAALCGVAAGLAYMLLTGSQVPMRRAVAMAALLALAVLVDRRGSALRALAIAALVVLLLQPEALLGPSFQMSFAAVLALVTAWEGLRHSWLSPRRDRGLLERGAVAFAALLLTSLVATAATTPFIAYHFQRIQMYGIVANALAVPLTSLWIMPSGVIALLLLPIGLHEVGFWPMGEGIAIVLSVASVVASWPLASPTLPAMPAWGAALCGLGLCALCLLRGRGRLLGTIAILAGIGSAWVVRQPDILLAADGRQLALRAEGALHRLAVSGADRFTTEQWSARAGGLPVLPLRPGEGTPAVLRCEERACAINRGSAAVPSAVILLDGGPTPWCGRTPLIVSLQTVRSPCVGSRVVDRRATWRNGAHALWLDGPTVLSDAQWRGNRPWVILPRQRWRSERSDVTTQPLSPG